MDVCDLAIHFINEEGSRESLYEELMFAIQQSILSMRNAHRNRDVEIRAGNLLHQEEAREGAGKGGGQDRIGNVLMNYQKQQRLNAHRNKEG
jgi:hypothetical protein